MNGGRTREAGNAEMMRVRRIRYNSLWIAAGIGVGKENVRRRAEATTDAGQ
jgi:hypothetical protein